MLGYTALSFIIHTSDWHQFADSHISRGSVPTYLRCDGIFKYEFVANLPLSLPAKEFWKLDNIWGKLWARVWCLVFFDTRCRTKPLGMQASIFWCLSRAKICWEGCDRKGIQHKNGGWWRLALIVLMWWSPDRLSVHRRFGRFWSVLKVQWLVRKWHG